ncbi:predicted protein [Thalassiosira pseudonana CCMP1335]|uniref:PSI domain-containing protein n=1 Tax=Thalassiosira pseudonana TaxID=35128 RepID=B8C636_THAPS|nr:predicted protein [Thalassiosira pseudonana CCMP1335]EED91224.1 predicted protein [Thalassiosira pseudonana CCMP1335]
MFRFIPTIVLASLGNPNSVFATSPPLPACDEAKGCGECLSNPDCTWWNNIKYCEDGCGMNGCGANVCPRELRTCEECLGGSDTPAGGQYFWSPYSGTNGQCIADCKNAPADAPCYKAKSDVDPSGYGPEICAFIGVNKCNAATDCGSCLNVEGEFCTWFEDIQWCEDGCGMDGCGAQVCASELTICADCLGGPGTDASGQYSWSPYSGAAGECLNSCMDAPADASCYPGKTIFDQTGYDPSICPSISVCRKKSSCGECLADGACAWSEGSCFDSCMDDEVPADGSCFEGKIYTPDEACPAEESVCKKKNGCSACLKAECSFSVGDCYDDCMDAPADASCFDGNRYTPRQVCDGEENEEKDVISIY